MRKINAIQRLRRAMRQHTYVNGIGQPVEVFYGFSTEELIMAMAPLDLEAIEAATKEAETGESPVLTKAVAAYRKTIEERQSATDTALALSKSLAMSSAETTRNNRVTWAEGLISQLPATHEGRNGWLLNYGVLKEAVERRLVKGVQYDHDTTSAELRIAGVRHAG